MSPGALHWPAQTTPELIAIYAPPATLQAMLDVEAALARAQAHCRIVPASAARQIARACDARSFDGENIARRARQSGNLAIPLVAELTARVARSSPAAAKYVHWGATSQDIIDTAAMLQLRSACAVIETDLNRLLGGLARLARRHRRTVMTGRTLLQAAAPVSFGLKAASWFDALRRHRERLAAAQARCLVLQFGGAVGTMAALGSDGANVARELGHLLGLPVPAIPWHAERDRVGEIAAVLGLLVGTLGKMARDISLLMQSEVDEAREPAAPGRGGSSTLPHKRNPVAAAAVLAASVQAPQLVATLLAAQVQEHERALGGWQAEWTTLPELVCLAGGALRQMAETIDGLQIDRARMKDNLKSRQGLVMAEAVSMALARQVGKKTAHEMIERASCRVIEDRVDLRQAIEADPQIARHFDRTTLDRLFDPARGLGAASLLIDRALGAGARKRR